MAASDVVYVSHPSLPAGEVAKISADAFPYWATRGWVAATAPTDPFPAGHSAKLSVDPASPAFAEPGVWVQTGLGPSGTDMTIWIEDGS